MVRLIPENNTLREYLAQELVNQNNSMIMSGRTGEYHDREMTLDDACQFIFHTYTGSNVELTGRPRQGIQLSPKGYRWMKAYYESYRVESSFHLINNHLLRISMQKAQTKLVDGYGKERIIKAILEI